MNLYKHISKSLDLIRLVIDIVILIGIAKIVWYVADNMERIVGV